VWNVLRKTLGCASQGDLLRVERGTLARAIGTTNRGRLPQQRIARVALNRFIADVAFADQGVFATRLHLRRRHVQNAAGGSAGALVQGGGGGDGGHPSDLAAAAYGHARGRDHFTDAEMQSLLRLTCVSLRDRLVLRILSETGLRRRAVSWLLVENCYDRAAGAGLPVCAATEKGMVTRRFVLSAATRALLKEYIDDAHPGATTSRWLFPSPRDPVHPVTPVVVNLILQRACRLAGIHGRFTHSHAVRKFVVVQLMSQNNRLEDVSKWLGHRTVDLTYGVYWDVSEQEVAGSMNIPWLKEADEAETNAAGVATPPTPEVTV
jgi:integrase